MEDTSKRGTATKTKTITITKTMGTKNNLTEDTMKRITDMSKMGMVTMIKSTDTSKRDMDINVLITVTSNHLMEGIGRVMVIDKLDTGKPDTVKLDMVKPDMDKPDTETVATGKLLMQVATTKIPTVIVKGIPNTLPTTNTPFTRTVATTIKENTEARINLLPTSMIMILE